MLVVALTAGLGAFLGVAAGFGGAVLIVPGLLLVGLPAPAAATAGLLSVVTATASAAPFQVVQRLANHRLAVTIELAAASGVVAGALLLEQLPEFAFRLVLAAAILVAAAGGARRRPVRNRPDPSLRAEDIGETPGALAGAYALGADVVPYRAIRIRVGAALSLGIGFVSGLTGTAGGYLKTPLMSEVMHVPAKVAAATSTFATGLTAAAGLAVLLPRGHLDATELCAVVLAGLLGGNAGARLQRWLAPTLARRGLGLLLVVVAGVILWTA
ncbi:MAG: sulfite exporter TauE/SafE family protein [Nitriliruptoraceae bacterium]|nr:sulfite exporter TauE/SafE family protein [Nitriliruptoraceae bacterium]